MDRQLKIGATYRHWRAGDLYKVLKEVLITASIKEGMVLRLKNFGPVLATTQLTSGSIAVVYETLTGDGVGQRFVRDRNSFLEVLGDEEEGTMYYRFEMVNNENI